MVIQKEIERGGRDIPKEMWETYSAQGYCKRSYLRLTTGSATPENRYSLMNVANQRLN